MDFELTESQKMLKSAARDFFEQECPKRVVREIQESDLGYSPELWHKMVDLGWVGMIFPEEYGGSEASLLDLTLLYEEMGRALLPSPYLSSIICGLTILECGSEPIKREFIPKIAKGEVCFSLALTEPDYSWDASSIITVATPSADSYLINGTKLFIPYANVVDYILAVARTGNTTAEESISLFIVDAKNSPGFSCVPLYGSFAGPLNEVVFDNVKVSESNKLGEINKGWHYLREPLKAGIVLLCAEMVGGAEFVVELTINYAKERMQFGQYIGSFQRVQDRIINMVNDLDKARWVTYEAAWKLSEALPCTTEVSVAKVLASTAYRDVCREAAHVFAGPGFMKDFDLWLYHKKAWEDYNFLGSPAFHRKIVAAELAK